MLERKLYRYFVMLVLEVGFQGSSHFEHEGTGKGRVRGTQEGERLPVVHTVARSVRHA